MQIRRIKIKNYRSILEESVDIEPLTAIVGPNGAGKSAAIRAINEFYNTTRSAGIDDFYNRDQSVLKLA
jgi:putative ATP-dependent endonuclease of OLD family